MGPALTRLGAMQQRRRTMFRARICAISNCCSHRLLTETEQGRAQSTAELRSDLKMLTRTIAAVATMSAEPAHEQAAQRGGSNGLEAWPGYVDALSTLLMVTIFVLLVFVLAEAFLSSALTGSDNTIDHAAQPDRATLAEPVAGNLQGHDAVAGTGGAERAAGARRRRPMPG